MRQQTRILIYLVILVFLVLFIALKMQGQSQNQPVLNLPALVESFPNFVDVWPAAARSLIVLVLFLICVSGTILLSRHGYVIYLAHRDLCAIEDEFAERLALWTTMHTGNGTNRGDRLEDFDRTARKTVDVYQTMHAALGTEGKASVQFRDMHAAAPIFKEEALTVMKLSEDERRSLDAMRLIVRNNAAYMRLLLKSHITALRTRIIRDLEESERARHNPPLEVLSVLADLVGAPATVAQLGRHKERGPRYSSRVLWLAVRLFRHPSSARIVFDGKTGMEAIDFLRLADPGNRAPVLG